VARNTKQKHKARKPSSSFPTRTDTYLGQTMHPLPPILPLLEVGQIKLSQKKKKKMNSTKPSLHNYKKKHTADKTHTHINTDPSIYIYIYETSSGER
jgi:hypothetical protein